MMRVGMECGRLVGISLWLCRALSAHGLMLRYKGGPYEDASAGMVQSACDRGTLDESGLGRAAPVWRHAAHCLAWGSGVFRCQPGARPRRTVCLAGAQYLQLPAEAH